VSILILIAIGVLALLVIGGAIGFGIWLWQRENNG
jgi:hypothetical protein